MFVCVYIRAGGWGAPGRRRNSTELETLEISPLELMLSVCEFAALCLLFRCVSRALVNQPEVIRKIKAFSVMSRINEQAMR
jgi:hypothetical protein